MTEVRAGQPVNLAANQIANQKITPIVFQGKASEYFGIWIVNLLLSLVTLGVYSAWAKVRRKKYFYNNTLIDNVGFDYHAKPMSILKGRLIAVAILLVATIHPILQSLVFLIIFIFLPWLVVRGSIFNSRNTSHRGLRFDFVGTVNKAVRVFIGLPMLTFFTLGLILPYIAHEKSQFLMSNHRFGLSQFNMQRVVKSFYKVYLIVFIIPFIGILAAIAIPAYQAYVTKAKAAAASHAEITLPNVQAFAPINPQMLLAANDVPAEMPTEQQKVERVYSDNTPTEIPAAALRAQQVEQAAEIGDVNAGTAMPAEAAVTEGATESTTEQLDEATADDEMPAKTAEEMAAEEKAIQDMLKKQQENEMQEKIKGWLSSPLIILAGLGGLLLYGFFIFSFLGYFQSRISNLVWNNTTLDKLSFKSSLRARDFMWLYSTNMLAIMFTFGLATPWAQIRMARYRASKLQIVGDVDFDQFVGDKKAEVKATGEEIADMFDVDLSFG